METDWVWNNRAAERSEAPTPSHSRFTVAAPGRRTGDHVIASAAAPAGTAQRARRRTTAGIRSATAASALSAARAAKTGPA
jgi:hypothetical protein